MSGQLKECSVPELRRASRNVGGRRYRVALNTTRVGIKMVKECVRGPRSMNEGRTTAGSRGRVEEDGEGGER